MEQNKNKHMESYEKFEKILETGVTKEELWDEMVQWLDEDRLSEFADDFISENDIDIEED